MRRHARTTIGLMSLCLALTACGQAPSFSPDELALIRSLSELEEVPPDPTNAVADDPDAAHMGRFLFFDKRLSGNGEFSCASCHDPDLGFSDDLPVSETIAPAGRHAPTLLNTAYNRWYFWDGRCDSLWCQAVFPIEHPDEMGGNRLAVAHLVTEDAEISVAYAGLFGPVPDLSDAARFPANARPVPTDPDNPHDVAWNTMTEEDQQTINGIYTNAAKTIAAYERLLVRPHAPFDDYVKGLESDDPTLKDALSPAAERGLKLFVSDANCHLCHMGPTLSNLEFHNIGLGPRDWLSEEDVGRYSGIERVRATLFNGEGDYSDDQDAGAEKLAFLKSGDQNFFGAFKTPTLRNVTDTAPYMHGGHFETLTEVVTYYSDLDEVPLWGHREETLIPLELDAEQKGDLVSFLEHLTGEPLDEALLTAPPSPLP